jgi:alpha-tubulin suppressor-like RCC1 family protein
VQVTVGVDHVCALTGRGQAFCWGKNEQGQLGDGTFTASSDPVPVSGGATWVQLSAGWYHSCGVTSRGSAFCWGSNAAGQLAADGFSPSPSPVRIVVR